MGISAGYPQAVSRVIEANDVKLHVALYGEGPLVLMVHGFPESAHSWRYQIGPVVEAGFTACVLDVRGYGRSDKPYDVAAYAMEHMVADCVAVAEALSPAAPAVLVGHDWGAPIVWNSAFTRPDVFRAVAGLSAPFFGVAKRPYPELFRRHYTDKGKFFYQEYFQTEGVAEVEIEADIRDFLLCIFWALSGDAPFGTFAVDKPAGARFMDGMPRPEALPAWLREDDLDRYAAEFAQSGFRGPLNRYRNYERDWAWLQPFAGRLLEQPSLFIGGTHDPVTYAFGAVEDPLAVMQKFAPNMEGHVLRGCGHWTQQERPAEVNAILTNWLKRL